MIDVAVRHWTSHELADLAGQLAAVDGTVTVEAGLYVKLRVRAQ